MRVLVAGGAGFIGSHLVERLLVRPDVTDVVVVDNLWTGVWENLEHVRDPRLKRVTKHIEDFRAETKFDEVIHLASPASPKWYMADPRSTISANVGGALRLLDLLKVGGRFSFTSTSEVYGDPKVTPQPETYRGSVDCTGPRAAYDEGKRCTEALLFEMRRTSGLQIRVARIFNAYGRRTRVNDGRAISNFIAAALAGRPIKVYGNGAQTRSWGYVDDIVAGLETLFWGADIDHSGPLNIGNDREVSVLETARYIQSLIPGARIAFGPPAPDDPSNRRPDLSLAYRVLPGWRCKTPYEDGIRNTLEWFQSQATRGICQQKAEAFQAARSDGLAPALALSKSG